MINLWGKCVLICSTINNECNTLDDKGVQNENIHYFTLQQENISRRNYNSNLCPLTFGDGI